MLPIGLRNSLLSTNFFTPRSPSGVLDLTLRHSITDTTGTVSARQQTPLDWEPTDPRVIRIDVDDDGERHMAVCVPGVKSFEDFDFSASSVPRATLDYLASLEWVRAKENPCFVGPPGTGKSHCLVALGHAAVDAGYKVRYFVAAELVESLYRGLADNSVGKVIESILRADLVICDEIGFAPLDDTGAQLFFRFVAAAYERRSLAIASHWPFEKAHMFRPTCARWCLKLTASPRRPALHGRRCRPCNAGRRPRSARRR